MTNPERVAWQNRMYSAKHVHGAHYREKVVLPPTPAPLVNPPKVEMTKSEKASQQRRLAKQYLSTRERREWQERMYSATHVHGAHYVAEMNCQSVEELPPSPVWSHGERERTRWQFKMYNAKHVHGASSCYDVTEGDGSPRPGRDHKPSTAQWSRRERKEWQLKMYNAKHVHGVYHSK